MAAGRSSRTRTIRSSSTVTTAPRLRRPPCSNRHYGNKRRASRRGTRPLRLETALSFGAMLLVGRQLAMLFKGPLAQIAGPRLAWSFVAAQGVGWFTGTDGNGNQYVACACLDCRTGGLLRVGKRLLRADARSADCLGWLGFGSIPKCRRIQAEAKFAAQQRNRHWTAERGEGGTRAQISAR